MGNSLLHNLGAFPSPDDRFVLLTLAADGRLTARSNVSTSQADIVAFLRNAADDLAAGSAPGSGLVIPGTLAS